MKLLSADKTRRVNSTEKQVASLYLQRKKLEEEKKMALLVKDWDVEKKKEWDKFVQFNQDIQKRKAKLIDEINVLEEKLVTLSSTIKIHI